MVETSGCVYPLGLRRRRRHEQWGALPDAPVSQRSAVFWMYPALLLENGRAARARVSRYRLQSDESTPTEENPILGCARRRRHVTDPRNSKGSRRRAREAWWNFGTRTPMGERRRFTPLAEAHEERGTRPDRLPTAKAARSS